MKSATVGVALSASRTVAVAKGVTVADCALDAGSPDALATFFSQIQQATGLHRVRVFLAPDLCELRVLELPPLARDRAARALARAAARHFLSAAAPVVVDVVRTREKTRTLAVAAPAGIVEGIEQAAAQARLQIEAISSCYQAWCACSGKAEQHVLVPLPETVELLRVRDGVLLSLRRFPRTRTDLAETAIAAEPEIPVVSPSQVAPAADGDAMYAAAAYTGPPTFGLKSESTQGKLAARRTRSVRLQWASALVLLCCAVGLERWGLQRELDGLRSLRGGLQGRAGGALSAWDNAQSAVTTMSEIARLESARSNWSGLLLIVAEQLPDSARLLAFQGQQDTMTLELAAPDAVAALESLKEKPAFAQLRIVGSIQRRERESESATEHFVVASPIHSAAPKRK